MIPKIVISLIMLISVPCFGMNTQERLREQQRQFAESQRRMAERDAQMRAAQQVEAQRRAADQQRQAENVRRAAEMAAAQQRQAQQQAESARQSAEHARRQRENQEMMLRANLTAAAKSKQQQNTVIPSAQKTQDVPSVTGLSGAILKRSLREF